MKSVGEKGLSQLERGKGDEVSRREGVKIAGKRERGLSQSERRGTSAGERERGLNQSERRGWVSWGEEKGFSQSERRG